MEQQLKRVQDKMQQLIRQYQSVQKENERLRAEKELLQKKLQGQQEQMELLDQKLNALKIAKSGWNEEDKAVLEKKMNQYIKEIDRCIAMLAE